MPVSGPVHSSRHIVKGIVRTAKPQTDDEKLACSEIKTGHTVVDFAQFDHHLVGFRYRVEKMDAITDKSQKPFIPCVQSSKGDSSMRPIFGTNLITN